MNKTRKDDNGILEYCVNCQCQNNDILHMVHQGPIVLSPYTVFCLQCNATNGNHRSKKQAIKNHNRVVKAVLRGKKKGGKQ